MWGQARTLVVRARGDEGAPNLTKETAMTDPGKYVIGASIVWAGLFIATAVVLQGTPHFGQLLPILAGGMVWFVIIVPGAFFKSLPTKG